VIRRLQQPQLSLILELIAGLDQIGHRKFREDAAAVEPPLLLLLQSNVPTRRMSAA
jgi:hypothetical protein